MATYEDLMKQLQQAQLRLQHQNSLIKEGIAVSSDDIKELQSLIKLLQKNIDMVKEEEMRGRCDSESPLFICEYCNCWKLRVWNETI